jgi:putative flippase GtrA
MRLRGRPLRYVLVGGWNTGFGVGFFTALYLFSGTTLGYITVLTVAQIVAVLQSHLTQRTLVWRSHAPYLPELLRFSTIFAVTFGANLVLLGVCVAALHTPVLVTQWSLTLLLLLPTYLVQRSWAFRAAPLALPDAVVVVAGERA